MFIRVYSKLGKEHIYTFKGYSTLNNELTIYSHLGIEDVSIRNLQIAIEAAQPCSVYIRDGNEECTLDGARYDEESRKILFDKHKVQLIGIRA